MKELTQYRIKDSSMEPMYHKGDIVKLQKLEDQYDLMFKIIVVQTREKCFIGRYLYSQRVGSFSISKGLDRDERIYFRIGRKKYNFYLVNGLKN